MVHKYLRRKQYSIDADYRYYLVKEKLFHHLKPKEAQKANYIWNVLLKQDSRIHSRRKK